MTKITTYALNDNITVHVIDQNTATYIDPTYHMKVIMNFPNSTKENMNSSNIRKCIKEIIKGSAY